MGDAALFHRGSHIVTLNTHSRLRIDLAGWTREATQGDPGSFLALFEEADRLGFHGVWFNEFRLIEPPAPYPSPLLLAAALLARTERLRVGLSVLVLPLHNPLLLAEEIEQVRFQSGGRLDVGVGRGAEAMTLRALGIDPADTRPRFESACLHLRQRLPLCPVYVAGTTTETLGFALNHALPLLFSLEPPETKQLAQFALALEGQADAAHCARAVLSASSLSRYLCIAPTRRAALEQVDAMLPRLHERRVYFAARRGVSANELMPTRRDQALAEQIVCGTPEECVAQLQALQLRTGVGQVRLVFNGNGVFDNAHALKGMRLFAKECLLTLG